MNQINPFLVEGYLSPDYFCDRVEETALLVRHVTNQCNVALIAPRRLGKSGLIHNCFHQKEIRDAYHCVYVDVYDSKNLNEFVYLLGKGIFSALKPKGRQVWEAFVSALKSLTSVLSFDINGNPEWSVGVGDIPKPDITLEEIFFYLEQADKPCIIAIDEFQVIEAYPEKTVEATLRKLTQNCRNANFIFSGSKRHMMALMFTSQSRPFYHSSSIMGLEPIDERTYLDFANHHLDSVDKRISAEAFHYLYDSFDGVTWYIQYVLNMLFSSRSAKQQLDVEDVESAVGGVLKQHKFAYQALLFLLTAKQKQVLMAIAQEGKPQSVLSQAFLKKYSLGASAVQGAVKVLLEKDFITQDDGYYQLCDKFFSIYLSRDV